MQCNRSAPSATLPTTSISQIEAQKKALEHATYNPANNLTLPQSDGLFVVNKQPDHPYLVETNPAFANYTNFISSDYFFDKIGIDPERTTKRLGDGFYETRLLRNAIFETTGKRYLAGQSSDQAQYRYLMDNAIASQQRLELRVGIALNAEQVARLTHDIVWMVEQVVDGQKVLVPVYYAASVRAKDLHTTGSLITAETLSVTAGEINNSGTLEAQNHLDISSANDLPNRGTLHGGDALTVEAQRHIRNTGGHIISSGDMRLIARTGDITLDILILIRIAFFLIAIVLDALLMAVWRRKPKQRVIIHSDQGSQFGSDDWTRFMKVHSLDASMSRAENCYDNAVAESFFSSLKKEKTRRKSYRSRDNLRADIFDYIEVFYNRRRRHSYLGHISPEQFELEQCGNS